MDAAAAAPTLFFRSSIAPVVTSVVTMPSWPFSAARWSGVQLRCDGGRGGGGRVRWGGGGGGRVSAPQQDDDDDDDEADAENERRESARQDEGKER